MSTSDLSAVDIDDVDDSIITVSTRDDTKAGPSNVDAIDALNFQYRSHVKERRAPKLWAIEFNTYLKPDQPKIFVALGGAQFSIYECANNGIKLQMRFVDPDANEDFWTCCWSTNRVNKRSILVTGGERGVIRIVEPEVDEMNETSAKHLIGHGGAINQLKCPRKKPYLLASASLDRSIRLWNIDKMVCIATFHGVQGHRDGIVTIDFNSACTKLVSGGLDHLIAIWDLTKSTVANAIESSCKYNAKKATHSFQIVLDSYPMFRSRQIHANYIDCVQWIGDLILSKSNLNDLLCWNPDLRKGKSGKISEKAQDPFELVADFNLTNCGYYFMRFVTDAEVLMMASGQDNGNIIIWDLSVDDPTKFPLKILKHPQRVTTARHMSFTRDGNNLVICCDDGSIWHYQRKQANQ